MLHKVFPQKKSPQKQKGLLGVARDDKLKVFTVLTFWAI